MRTSMLGLDMGEPSSRAVASSVQAGVDVVEHDIVQVGLDHRMP